MAAPAVLQPAAAAQPAVSGPQHIISMCHQPDSCQVGAVASLKRKCPSRMSDLLSQQSVLDLEPSGSRGSGDSDCFTLDPGTFSQGASPQSQQLSFRPHTPGNSLGKRRRLSQGSLSSGSGSRAGSCGPTPLDIAAHPDDASPASANLLPLPSVPPPIAALQSGKDSAACEQAAHSGCQLFDIGAADASAPQPCGQELLQQQVAMQQAHHQQLLAAQQQQQQQHRAAQQAAASVALLRASALSRCATMPPAHRQPQQQPASQQAGGIAWPPALALPSLARLRRSTSDNAAGTAAAARMLAYPPLGPLPGGFQQPSGVQPFSELLAEAERRRCIPQLQHLRSSHSVGSRHVSAPSLVPAAQAAVAAASIPAAAAPFTFAAEGAAAGFQTRSAHAAYSQQAPAFPAPLFSFRPREGGLHGVFPLRGSSQLPLQQQHVVEPPAVQQAPKAAPTQRRWPPAGAPGGAGGAPQLLARWGRALPLHRGETLLLALHMWERLQPKVKPQELLRKGCPQPWQAALLGCLWVAAKLEERRRGLPSASKIGELLGLDRNVVATVELYVMEALEWAPTAGWQARRLDFRA